jgi:rRNA maturation endonuclease Nob1
MAVQLDGKATEKQRKYLGYLSSQGKERFGKDFSIRKMAEEQGISWDEMSVEEANKLISEVKEMLEKTEDFTKTDLEIIEEVTKAAQKEEKPEQASLPSGQKKALSTNTYMIQLVVPEDKLTALTVVLEAMNLGYILLQEVRA